MSSEAEISNNFQNLNLSNNLDSRIDDFFNSIQLNSTKTDEEISLGKSFLSESFEKRPEHLHEKLLENPQLTLKLIRLYGLTRYVIPLITRDESLRLLNASKNNIKEKTIASESLEFNIGFILVLIERFKYSVEEVSSIFSILVGLIDSKPKLALSAILKIYSIFNEGLLDLIEENLEILSLKNRYVPAFQYLSLIFQLNATTGFTLFHNECFQTLMSTVGINSPASVVKEGLKFLSVACINEDSRTLISNRYYNILVEGVNSNDEEVTTLSALVIVKTWNFSKLNEFHKITLDDLVYKFTSNLDEYSIEGLSFLCLKESVRVKLRKDDELLFELSKCLENINCAPQPNILGVLMILAKLSSIEEDDEVNELSKQTKRGLDDGADENQEDIELFIEQEIIERKIIESLYKAIDKLSINMLEQCVNIIYSASKKKQNSREIVQQGGIDILLKYLNSRIERLTDSTQGFTALASLLMVTDPHSKHIGSSAKSAFNQLLRFLKIEDIRNEERFRALIALTNLAILDNGSLSADQWDTIDNYLKDDNTKIRRAAIELLSNLLQHKHLLFAVFNFENPSSKKRFELVRSYITLKDTKSQCSAVSSLTFGITFPPISQELAKDEVLLNNLIMVLQSQIGEQELVERVIFVLYYLLFFSAGRIPHKQNLSKAVHNAFTVYSTGDTADMIHEIQSML